MSSISNNLLNNFKLSQIQNIKISGLDQKDNKIFFSKLKFNYNSILFIDKKWNY